MFLGKSAHGAADTDMAGLLGQLQVSFPCIPISFKAISISIIANFRCNCDWNCEHSTNKVYKYEAKKMASQFLISWRRMVCTLYSHHHHHRHHHRHHHQREADDLCGHRGLAAGSDHQTFAMSLPHKLRAYYDKVSLTIVFSIIFVQMLSWVKPSS